MSPAVKVILKIYTGFCCRLPQPKLESSDIMLDMLNELNRCPKELYNILSETDQERFKVTVNRDEPNEDIDTDNAQSGEQEIVLLRHQDRFPSFALRYFDDTNAFKTLRFQVQLGKILKKAKYEKVIFGETRDRELTKPIFTFCKLLPMLKKYEVVNQDDIKNKLINPKYTSEFIDTWTEKLPDGTLRIRNEITQYSPHYNFGENIIGFKIFENPNKMQYQDNTLPIIVAQKKSDAPDAFISNYELRNLFLYQYLHQQDKIQDSAEKFLTDYFSNIKRFLKDVKEGKFLPLTVPPDFTKNEKLPFKKDDIVGTKLLRQKYNDKQADMKTRRKVLEKRVFDDYKISYNSIPHDIREYLLAYNPVKYNFFAKTKIQEQQKIIDGLLKDIEKDKYPKVGEQATWLAEDILFMMPHKNHDSKGKNHKQKMNNDQFRVLQRSLAYFPTHKTDLIAYFKELGLTEGKPETIHPFLNRIEVEKCFSISDFYKDYLDKKKFFTEKMLKFVYDKNNRFQKWASDDEIKSKYGYLLPNAPKTGLNKNYNFVPILLPRGLFNEAISKALDFSNKEGFKGKINNAVYNLESMFIGDTQDFYDLPHIYRTKDRDGNEIFLEKSVFMTETVAELNALKSERTSGYSDDEKMDLKNEKKDAERKKDSVLEREQDIRYQQANDRALWLMILQRQKTEHLDIDFSNLKLKNIETILDQETTVSGKIANCKIVDKLPIKRYGDLRRILKDRRLENLVKYYDDANTNKLETTKIDYAVIKKELEIYDARRVDFFKLIFEFEEKVFNAFKNEFDLTKLDVEGGYFDHEKEILKVATDHLSNFDYKENVYWLRNKFLHNEIPYYDWLNEDIKKSTQTYYCNKIFDIAENYYKNLLKLIL